MTLKNFKESINRGDSILCTKIEESKCIDFGTVLRSPLEEIELKDKFKKLRLVTYKDTTGFYLATPEDKGRGSFCGWPKASELEYNEGDNTFIINEHTPQGELWQKRYYQIIK